MRVTAEPQSCVRVSETVGSSLGALLLCRWVPQAGRRAGRGAGPDDTLEGSWVHFPSSKHISNRYRAAETPAHVLRGRAA